METNGNKWIVYDGNCGMCLFSKKVFSRIGFIREDKCRNYHELDAATYEKVDLERFKHGMAYVDSGNQETLYGLEGVLAAFSEKRPYLKKWSRGTTIFRVLNYLYNAICYNRYFIFPKKQRFACSCEPEFNARYYRRWVFLGVLFSVIISALFGAAVSGLFGIEPGLMAMKSVLIVGAGWLLQFMLVGIFMNHEQFLDYTRHIALIMFIGVLVLVPGLLLFWLPIKVFVPLAIISVIASSVIMTRMHIERMRFMGIGQKWTVAWFLSLQLTAISLILHFQLFNL